jgi:NADH dehydrogenase
LPKDYPDLNFDLMQITLIEGSPTLLNGMSAHASEKALYYLGKIGIKVMMNTRVNDYDGDTLTYDDNKKIETKTVIWAAGISAIVPDGLPAALISRGNRILVDEYNHINGYDDVFAIGDVSLMVTDDYPNGHAQVAQVAIQQGTNLSRNFMQLKRNAAIKKFKYIDRGSMATIGRNHAVADLSFIKFSGFLAWLTWMFIHLMAIVGVKNRLLIFINWMWNYLTYDQSLRLILWAAKKDPNHVISPLDRK